MYKLDIDYFATDEGQFRSSNDIINNFEIDKIKNYQNFEMTEQDLQKIKKGLLIVARHVEEKKEKKFNKNEWTGIILHSFFTIQ